MAIHPDGNQLKTHGRLAFAEFTEVYQIETDFKSKVEAEFGKMVESVVYSIRKEPLNEDDWACSSSDVGKTEFKLARRRHAYVPAIL